MQLSGLSTGIDTGQMIKQLMQSEQMRLLNLKVLKNDYNTKNTAFDDLKGQLSGLRNAAKALSDEDTLDAYNATSSDKDILSASANTEATEGNHEIVVKQLANSERWVHDGFLFKEDRVGAGNFIFSYDHTEVVIPTDDETTLQDLVGLINKDPDNPGVTAGILEYDDKNDGVFHLVLSGKEAGSDFQITINDTTTNVLSHENTLQENTVSGASSSTKITDLLEFSGTLTGSSTEYITIEGDIDGAGITASDFYIESTSSVTDLLNQINTAFGGDGIAKISSDGAITIEDQNGKEITNFTLTFNANGGGGTLAIDVDKKFTEATQEDIDLSTKLTDLDIFTGTLAEGEIITIDGTDAEDKGITPVEFNVTSEDYTIGHLLDRINDAFDGVATAKLIDGKINLIDDVSGAIKTTMTLSSSSGSFDFSGLAFGNDKAGGTIGAELSNIMGSSTFTETQQAQDSMIKVDGYPPGENDWISRSSNTVENVIDGVTVTLKDTTDTSDPLELESIQLTINRDEASLKGKVSALISAYNSAAAHIRENSGYDEETGKAGIFISSSMVRTIKQSIRDPFSGAVGGFDGDLDSFFLAGNIGFKFDAKGVLSLDTEVFDDALSEDYAGVLEILGADKSGRIHNESSNEGGMTFYGASDKHTQAGEYEVKVEILDGDVVEGSAYIRKKGDTEWLLAKVDDNIIMAPTEMTTSTEYLKAQPTFSGYGIQIEIDPSAYANGEQTASLNVKQGFAGELLDAVDKVITGSDGYISIEQSSATDAIKNIDRRIEKEQDRLRTKEARLQAKFARLEATLALLQQQQGAVSAMTY